MLILKVASVGAVNSIIKPLMDKGLLNRHLQEDMYIASCLDKITDRSIRDINAILTVSSMPHNYYGVDDVCLSVPTIVNRNGIRKVLKLPLTDAEIVKLQSSASTLKNMIKSLTL
jgi:L-lactate dehydrogenase